MSAKRKIGLARGKKGFRRVGPGRQILGTGIHFPRPASKGMAFIPENGTSPHNLARAFRFAYWTVYPFWTAVIAEANAVFFSAMTVNEEAAP